MDERDLLEDDQQNESFFSYERIEDNNNELLVNFEEETEDDADSCEQHGDHMASNCNKIIDCSLTPRIGMEFPDSDTAYEFYKRYALRQGFATRIFSSQRRKNGGDFYRRIYCQWNLSLHEPEHLRSLQISYNPEFDEDYRKWAKKKRDMEESEKLWIKLKEKYKHSFDEPQNQKQKNEVKSWRWLETMYEQRFHWVRAYLVKTFFAGIKSSQRSESINAFFDGFVSTTTPLSEFIDQYDNAVTKRRDTEEKEDFFCITTKPNFIELSPLEAQAGQVYTRNVFKKFAEEFKLIFHCRHKKLKRDGDDSSYQVNFNFKGKVASHVVNVIMSEKIFQCSCAKFENVGLLCRHILYLMKQIFDLESIPERYILERWTLNVRYKTTTIGETCEVQGLSSGEQVSALEAWNFRTFINQVYERSVSCKLNLKMASNCLHDLLKKFDVNDARQKALDTEVTLQHLGSTGQSSQASTVMSNVTIRDPSKCKTKGRPKKATRIPSGIHVAQSQTTTKKCTCKTCGETGHDARTCHPD
ncbi:hypothetical protein POM88_041387 [Heracleum sosnowskyi]|uniref:Protein FAR1-RELATED SEQUENCE n=1 Tax=Heracleum sosnowskyi TaxID=360622 RepID=A0AAD8HEW1_9APIA|nr:hypothetical protein POM88_041387 [Heracleum sosnowskyi]